MKATDPREEVATATLDQRYANLRLAAPQELSRLRTSIERSGILSPVLVATAVEPQRRVLVDGFKRLRIVTDLGRTAIWATLSPLDDKAAKVAMVAANTAHHGLCDLEEAWVVRSLCREHGLTQAEVGQALRRDKSWVCRRLMLAERLEVALQEDIRLGLLSATVARELVRLPRGNQEEMAEAIRRHALTSRQARWLVTVLLDSDDPQARRDVLADPLRYVAAAQRPPSKNDPRLGLGGNAIRRSLYALLEAGGWLKRNVERHAASGLDNEEAGVLLPLVKKAHAASDETTRLLSTLCGDRP